MWSFALSGLICPVFSKEQIVSQVRHPVQADGFATRLFRIRAFVSEKVRFVTNFIGFPLFFNQIE